MKLVSPLHRGSTCTWRCVGTPAPAARPIFAPRFTPSGLYAVAYRTVRAEEQPHVDIWPEELALGSPLPCVPLWLGVDIVVPLELEKSYLAACESLRLAS